MQKSLTFLLSLSLFFSVFLASARPASAVVQVGVVQGLVSDPSNNPLDAASVSVTCNGNVLNTTTDSSGFYFVQYSNGICTDGMSASVTATKGGQSGSNSGVLTDQGTIGILNLDVAVVHILAVPEFGLISGALAAVVSSGVLLKLRRKV